MTGRMKIIQKNGDSRALRKPCSQKRLPKSFQASLMITAVRPMRMPEAMAMRFGACSCLVVKPLYRDMPATVKNNITKNHKIKGL